MSHARTAPGADAALARLRADTKKLPARGNEAVKPKLADAARRAANHAAKYPCASLRSIARYRGLLRNVKGKRGDEAWSAVLTADALEADAALRALPKARRCGGAARPPTKNVKVRILSSNANRLRLRVTFPKPQFVPQQVGNRRFMQLVMDGMDSPADVGEPGVPTVSELFATPPGATSVARVSKVSSYTLKNVNLFPVQEDAFDQKGPPASPNSFDFPVPFSIDQKAYSSQAPFPRSLAQPSKRGRMRDLRVGGIELAGAQYSPRQHRLRVLTGLDVEIVFKGAKRRSFADARLKSPFNIAFDRIYRRTILNYGAVRRFPGDLKFPFCGEELLIITTNALRPAADTLAASRTAAGYLTSVKETGAGVGQIGTTKEQIRAFIRSRLNGACLIRPSYLILLGNTAQIPTFLVPCSAGGDVTACDIASDLPYALDGMSSDLFADIAYGRIPAADLTAANAVVDKIIGYETSLPAPAGAPFYRNATITSFFEPTYKCVPTPTDCEEGGTGHWELDPTVTRDARGFTKTTERVKAGMNADGYSVQRIYTTDPAVNPLEYYDGTAIPLALRRPTFGWDGSTTDFVSAFNTGKFLIFHRDHGWPGGWANPQLWNGDLASLTNGTKLPIVIAVNCASGRFDVPGDPSFDEQLLMKTDGGAAGVFGDSRNSPTWPNNNMSIGFFDAIFPKTEPTVGSTTPLRRLGDILLAGKQYMDSVEGPGSGGAYVEHYLYTLFGDPTMQMWIADPINFDLGRIKVKYIPVPFPKPGDPPFRVRVEFEQKRAERTIVTLTERGVPVGRALVRNGVALVSPLNAKPEAVGLSVAFEQDGFMPAQVQVPIG